MQIERRRTPHRKAAPRQSVSPPQSEHCCCFDNSTPSSSRTRSFKPMPVGIGPDELRGDFGAINRCRHDTKGLEQDRNIETGEMEQFGDFRVGQKPLDISPGSGRPRFERHRRTHRRATIGPRKAGREEGQALRFRCRSRRYRRNRHRPAGRPYGSGCSSGAPITARET